MSRAVTEHGEAVLAQITATPAVLSALEDAAGMVLADDVTAHEALPRFDSSSAHAPVRLCVVADLAAGTDEAPVVGPGTAARIMTGRPCLPVRTPSGPSRTQTAAGSRSRCGRPSPPVDTCGGWARTWSQVASCCAPVRS